MDALVSPHAPYADECIGISPFRTDQRSCVWQRKPDTKGTGRTYEGWEKGDKESASLSISG